MALLELNRISFAYPGSTRPALRDVCLTVNRGEFIVLCGRSGSGKSTLLKLLKRELAPAGELNGELFYEGKPLCDYPAQQLICEIGMVMQNPEAQIVMDEVRSELYFSMENVGIPPIAMRRRLAELAQVFDLEPLFGRQTTELSGGQQQTINLASVLLLKPRILLLDEPTAQLDPVAARQLLEIVRRIHEEYGVTVIMTEHRLDDVWPLADRILILDDGQIVRDSAADPFTVANPESTEPLAAAKPDVLRTTTTDVSPKAVGSSTSADLTRDDVLELFLPAIPKLFLKLGLPGPLPLTVKDGRALLARSGYAFPDMPPTSRGRSTHAGETPVMECREIHYRYAKDEAPVLHNCSLNLFPREIAAVIGANGSGKSTLLQLMGGLLKPVRGELRLLGQPLAKWKERDRNAAIAYLPQNPKLFFLCDSVEEELRLALEKAKELGHAPDQMEAVERFDLANLLAKHPHDLSGGEQQRAVLACLSMTKPGLLLLDEPTKGLDPAMKRALAGYLQTEKERGCAIVLVTHDIEFAAAYADRCAMLFHGAIAADAGPRELFSENDYYTTAVNKLVREWSPHAIVWEDVIPHER